MRGMADPEVLRHEARRLREAAATLRARGDALDDDLQTLRQRYPLPSPSLWQSPNATTYAAALTQASDELAQVGTTVHRYADDCEAEAVRRDHLADAAEQTAAAG